MPFRTFLFDLDGTLIDHFGAIHRSHVHTLGQFGLPPPTLEQVRNAVGLGLEYAIAKLAGPAHADIVPKAVPIYRAYWDRTLLDDVTLLPGAKELLGELKKRGLQAAVVTNKHGPSTRLICAHLGIDTMLAGMFGASDTPWLKPERALVEHVLARLHAEAASTLFIGDSPYDIQAAHNAGLPCWCVATGTHAAAELAAAKADRIFNNLSEAGSAILGAS